MTLEEVNKKFKYVFDKKMDSWTGLKSEGSFLVGDCEYYCITLKRDVEQFKDWDYYYCKLSGNGHCILHKNSDVIDCNVKRVVSLEQYNRMFTVTELKKYHWFVIGSKIAFAKVFTLFNKGNNYE